MDLQRIIPVILLVRIWDRGRDWRKDGKVSEVTPESTITDEDVAAPESTITDEAVAAPQSTITDEAVAAPQSTITDEDVAAPQSTITDEDESDSSADAE